MSRFNLLDEPWIAVLPNEGGQTGISLLELFRHAEKYRRLAGEMETQNFATLRLLLAVVRTVFSRFDNAGEPYPYLTVDDQMRQTCDVKDSDAESYTKAQEAAWKSLWAAGHFPDIVCRYLETWRDHFYLFDEIYPFYQATRPEIDTYLKKGHPTLVAGRTINRLISESKNKTALFSPIADEGKKKSKDRMTSAELARWLIMFQGYTGLFDKASLVGEGQSPSKGWLFDLGGLYLEGDNLFETILLNDIPSYTDRAYGTKKQSPCWEVSGEESMRRLMQGEKIDNLAQLYTNWSRVICIDPELDTDRTEIGTVKLPAIEHEDNFLEPMTVWHFNKSGEHKDHYTPRKHMSDRAMWRSFGVIAMPSSGNDQRRPEVLSHLNNIRQTIGSRQMTIHAVGLKDDENATSWVPVDEIADSLEINSLMISDPSDLNWTIGAADLTGQVATIYWAFLSDVVKIRNQTTKRSGKVLIDSGMKSFYWAINDPFRRWLASLSPDDAKESRAAEWSDTLRHITEYQARTIVRRATARDYAGIEADGHMINIVTAYNKLQHQLAKKLGKESKPSGERTDRKEVSLESNKPDHRAD